MIYNFHFENRLRLTGLLVATGDVFPREFELEEDVVDRVDVVVFAIASWIF